MVTRSRIKDCLKVTKFIEETMKNWRMKVIAGKKSVSEVKIQRGIFKVVVLLPSLFVIAMMLLNHILRK